MTNGCIVEGCTETVTYSRGLCRPCYTYAAMLIRTQKTTWRHLEETGCCLPATKSGWHPPSPFKQTWFAKGLIEPEVRVECPRCGEWQPVTHHCEPKRTNKHVPATVQELQDRIAENKLRMQFNDNIKDTENGTN